MMPESLFADIPPSDDAPPAAPAGELTCTVCGVPLSYSGRGRKPTRCDEHKRASSSSSSSSRATVPSKELDTACETLAAMYDALCMPLTMLHPYAGSAWSEQIDGLNSRNRTILANNRDLVKRINSMGQRGGNLAFIVSHVVAVAPVGMVLLGSARAAREARAEQYDTYEAQQVAPEDAAFVSGQNGTGVPHSFFEPSAG